MKFFCPRCGQKLACNDDEQGTVVSCPNCANEITVPTLIPQANTNTVKPVETKEESDVFSIVCELPQNYKTVIYLFYYEGYKVNEIAKLMNSTEGTIKTWLYRAREVLKTKLEGGFENE